MRPNLNKWCDPNILSFFRNNNCKKYIIYRDFKIAFDLILL